MPGSDLIEFMECWELSDQDSERKINSALQGGVDKSVEHDPGIVGMIGKGEELDTLVTMWMEYEAYPHRITAQLTHTDGPTVHTLTFSGNLFGRAITADSIKQVVRVGTVFERPSDAVTVVVTDVTGLATTPWDCTVVAQGGSVLSDDTGPIVWDRIGEQWHDRRDFGEPRALDRFFREVGTQIFAEQYEMTHTRQNLGMKNVQNEFQLQMNELTDSLTRQLGIGLLRSKPERDISGNIVYGNKKEISQMCGLCTWPGILQAEVANPDVYVNKASEPLLKSDIDRLLRNMEQTENVNFNKGNWILLVDKITRDYMQDFDISHREMTQDAKKIGFAVDTFHAKIGQDFKIVAEEWTRPGTLVPINLSNVKYGYNKNDGIWRKEIHTEGRYRRWLISFQTYGVVLRNARQSIGMIYGLPTSV